ncbi:MAG: hypothetical protein AAB221_08045 [Bacteroidota bacterium]
MAEKYRLWNVTYIYKASHIDGIDDVSTTYLIVAQSHDEALTKADGCFSYCDLTIGLLRDGEVNEEGLRLYSLRRSASEIRKTIRFPRPTLDSDVEDFDIGARIGRGGKTIEFIVSRK